MVAAGQFVHTGTPVVLWMDPGGYDAYRVERRFSLFDESSWETSKVAVKSLTTPNRYGLRGHVLSHDEVERVRGGGWDLSLLQEKVDQLVIHFDASGTSRQCFQALHDVRGLSVHFMLDLDGTIYQTLDLKERAWHATSSNSRSIGIEIANVGAYPPAQEENLREWYQPDASGQVRIVVPTRRQWAGAHRGAGAPGRRRRAHAGLCRPAGTTGAGGRRRPGHGTDAIRPDAPAVSGPDQAHRQLVPGVPQDPMRLSARRLRESAHEKDARRGTPTLPRHPGPLSHPDGQSGSRPGLSMGSTGGRRSRMDAARTAGRAGEAGQPADGCGTLGAGSAAVNQ